jgi:hypothetical protein
MRMFDHLAEEFGKFYLAAEGVGQLRSFALGLGPYCAWA